MPLADKDNVYKKGGEVNTKQKHQKPSTSDEAKPDFGPKSTASTGPALAIPSLGDDMQESVFQSVQTSSDMFFHPTGPEVSTDPEEYKFTGSTSRLTKVQKRTG